MSKKIIFSCLAMVVSIIPLISGSPAIAINPGFQQAQQLFRQSSKTRSVRDSDYEISVLNSLCASSKKDGDYQNPFNCNELIKCVGNQLTHVSCGASFLIFNPFYDGCVYPPAVGEIDECPTWPSVWRDSDPNSINCETLGQVPWRDAPSLILPSNPQENCGNDVIYCKNFQLVGVDTCLPGCGYSKALFGCLPTEICLKVDGDFGLIQN